MSYRTTAECFCDEYAAHRVLSVLSPPIDPELVGLGQSDIIRRYVVGANVGEYTSASDTHRRISFLDGSAAILLEGEGQTQRWEVLRT